MYDAHPHPLVTVITLTLFRLELPHWANSTPLTMLKQTRKLFEPWKRRKYFMLEACAAITPPPQKSLLWSVIFFFQDCYRFYKDSDISLLVPLPAWHPPGSAPLSAGMVKILRTRNCRTGVFCSAVSLIIGILVAALGCPGTAACRSQQVIPRKSRVSRPQLLLGGHRVQGLCTWRMAAPGGRY